MLHPNMAFNARAGETRSQTYNRLYKTDNPFKQYSIKKQERNLAKLKENYYKRQVETLENNKTKKRRNYTHLSLDKLLKRYTIKHSD